jgi:hypothetical protein
VAESAEAPPGPIPNPVVTRCSAGEYYRGDPVGGEAAAGTSQRRWCRGVEQWQLVGLITQRSEVRILPPLPIGKTRMQRCIRVFLRAFGSLLADLLGQADASWPLAGWPLRGADNIPIRSDHERPVASPKVVAPAGKVRPYGVRGDVTARSRVVPMEEWRPALRHAAGGPAD